MKVASCGEKPEFRPRSITITFESQDELDLFGSTFNNCKVATFLRDRGFNDPRKIYKEIKSLGGDIHKYACEF